MERIRHSGINTEEALPRSEKSPYPERSSVAKLDRLLRSNQSLLAELARRIDGGKRGKEYLESKLKRALDLGIGFPLAVVSTPAIFALGAAKVAEDGGPMFYIQERRTSSKGKSLKVMKMRSMKPDSDKEEDWYNKYVRGKEGCQDSRSTPLGSFMRKYDLDELPQFYQVVLGQLSLIGPRPCSEKSLSTLDEKWSKERLERWDTLSLHCPKGISGLAALFGTKLKEVEKRYHFDVFYAKNANLGLDLYLVWRTAGRMTRLLPG